MGSFEFFFLRKKEKKKKTNPELKTAKTFF